MYNIIQMRFQEGLIPRIIAQTPHMTICSEIRHGDISFPEPQLWNSQTTKEYIAYWKLHENEEEDYDFDEEAIHNMDT